jgi:hypothetical protein
MYHSDQCITTSYLCNIHNRLQSLSAPQAEPNKHQLLMAPYHSTRSPLNKLNGAMETMACGAKSGEFLRCCRWHGSMAVCTGR